MQIFSNNGATTLAVAVNALDTTITVVDASKFPVGEFKVTLETVDRSKNEIVLVTGVVGNVLTVVRAQEGTVATDFPVDAKVENRVTAEWLNTLQTTVDGMVDDTEVATTKAYSSSKVLELHNAQAEAIAHLSGASATFSSNVSQVVPEEPSAKVDISWVNGQASSNASIFALGTNEVNFYVDGNYSFLTTITLYRLSDGSNTTITFELYDADTGTVLKSISQPVDMTAGTKETQPLNVLVPITGATEANPVRMKVRMGMTAANGTLELFAFSSVLTAQALVSAGGKTYTSTEFTATAGQTAFNLAYTPGYVEVYHNGLKLSTADFTASNGTSIVLGTAAIAGDAIEVVAYSTFAVADSYTKAEVDGIVANIDALPSQAGNTGRYLTTDGTEASWGTIDLSSKQNTLVSGTNIKTINGESVLGSGDLTIAGGSSFTVTEETLTANRTLTEADAGTWLFETTANRMIFLPATPSKDVEFNIVYIGTTGNVYLEIKCTGDTNFFTRLYSGAAARVAFDSATGKWTLYGNGYRATRTGANAYSVDNATSLGYNANGSSYSSVAVGYGANGSSYGTAVGHSANASSSGVAVGYSADGSSNGIAVGSFAKATKKYGSAIGYLSKQERYGGHARSGDHSSTSKLHVEEVHWAGVTTDATARELFLHGVSANRCILLASSVLGFTVRVTGIASTTFEVIDLELKGTIKHNNSSVTTLVGTVTSTVINNELSGATAVLTADDTNEALKLTVTGLAGKTINWGAVGLLLDRRI